MDQNEIMLLIFGRVDALNGYWNLYIVVALGILGLMASGKRFTKQSSIKVLLTITFLVFAYSNWSAISGTNEQRRILITLAQAPYSTVADLTEPPSFLILALYHMILDLLVVGGIWLVRWPSD